MEIQKYMSLLVLVYALRVLSCLNLGRGSIVGGYSNGSCIDSEKQALLLFKESLVDNLNYLSSWVGNDCCAWNGITCNNRTGHIMQLDLGGADLRGDHINPSLLNLKYLTHLDLSWNKFDEVQIPEFFGSFKDLTYLNLCCNYFKGLVPHHLGNLSKLRSLDLGRNYKFDVHWELFYLLRIDSMGWLSKFSLLEYLSLSEVDLSMATDWSRDINMLPNSISVLEMSNCHLPNNILRHLSFLNKTSLTSLDLSGNQFDSSFPLWVLNNTGLAHLSLGSNQFNGPIPDSIGKLTSLINLDLSSNNFNSSIPESIGALTSLTNLDLSNNNLHSLIPQSIGNLTSLQSLDLAENDIFDPIPNEMGNLTALTHLNLNFNELRGYLPETFCQISKIENLVARSNQLSGSIPRCIGILSNLEYLDLAHNSWEGFLSEHHFANLTSLNVLYISSRSNLVLNVSSKWVPPFQLESIDLESVKVGPKFPYWLLTQRHIRSFFMSNTSMSDIPADWFASLLSRAFSLDLSNNDINGVDLYRLSALTSLESHYLSDINLSNNRLSGELPAFLCNLPSLSILVLSNNNFSGTFPQCLSNMTQMGDLDLMNNSLSGEIPDFLGSTTLLI